MTLHCAATLEPGAHIANPKIAQRKIFNAYVTGKYQKINTIFYDVLEDWIPQLINHTPFSSKYRTPVSLIVFLYHNKS